METANSLTNLQTFDCTECNQKITCRTAYQARIIVCPDCRREYKRGKAGFKATREKYEQPQRAPYLTPGITGKINGKEFLVTGVLYKKDSKEPYYWYEYYLFNP